jgi:hypothetical protein
MEIRKARKYINIFLADDSRALCDTQQAKKRFYFSFGMDEPTLSTYS